MRGKLSFFAEMSFVSTSAIGMIMGMPFVMGNNLVFLIGVAIIPAFFSVILIYPLHETPKFLLLKRNDKRKAFDAIKHYMKTGFYDFEYSNYSLNFNFFDFEIIYSKKSRK